MSQEFTATKKYGNMKAGIKNSRLFSFKNCIFCIAGFSPLKYFVLGFVLILCWVNGLFQKNKAETCRSQFDCLDRPAMKPLPPNPMNTLNGWRQKWISTITFKWRGTVTASRFSLQKSSWTFAWPDRRWKCCTRGRWLPRTSEATYSTSTSRAHTYLSRNQKPLDWAPAATTELGREHRLCDWLHHR